MPVLKNKVMFTLIRSNLLINPIPYPLSSRWELSLKQYTRYFSACLVSARFWWQIFNVLLYWGANSIHRLLIIASESYKLPWRFTDLKPCATLFAVTITVLEYYIETQICTIVNGWVIHCAVSWVWMIKVRKHCLQIIHKMFILYIIWKCSILNTGKYIYIYISYLFLK